MAGLTPVGARPASVAYRRRDADRKALQAALGVYLAVFAMKIVVYLFTGVLVLLAEALHTLSDIFVSGFLLVAVRIAGKDPDAEHALGHGRAENVAALVAATLFLSFTSYQLLVEAVPRLFTAKSADYSNIRLAVGVLLVSAVASAVPLVALLRRGDRGAAARAQTQELINDQLGLVAALVGTLLLAAGVPLADPLAAVVVAAVIGYEAIKLFRANASLLLGRSPSSEYLARLHETARSVPGVIDVSRVRAEYIGPDQVHAAVHVVVPVGTTVSESSRVADLIRSRVHDDDESAYCVIEFQSPPLSHTSRGAGLAQAQEETMPPHCDSLDGPVVTAAREALDAGDVDLVLPYVHAAGEAEVRAAFDAAMPVRSLGAPAREVADRLFFETVVRVHRAGEGAPYTGLKPAGLSEGPVIPLAERAIEIGSPDQVADFLAGTVRDQLKHRLDEVNALAASKDRSVRQRRRYVEAMLGFEVYAHHVYEAITAEGHAGHGEHTKRHG
jgi:cation diffusion facilitator family transporter